MMQGATDLPSPLILPEPAFASRRARPVLARLAASMVLAGSDLKALRTAVAEDNNMSAIGGSIGNKCSVRYSGSATAFTDNPYFDSLKE